MVRVMSSYTRMIEQQGLDTELLVDMMNEDGSMLELFETGSVCLEHSSGDKRILSLVADTPTSIQPFLRELCDRPAYGALAETFVLEAIRYYASKVSESKPEETTWDGSGINPKAWHQVAKDTHQKIVATFERKLTNGLEKN